MRIVVLSDTHGSFFRFQQVVEAQPSADAILFLGDGWRELEDIRMLYPNKKILSVRGNCDLGSMDPEEAVMMAQGKKILFTHGHNHGVKMGEGQLITFARAAHADIVLYGHTHVARTSYEEGIYVMNPGSASSPREGDPTYGIIDITKAGIVTNLITL